jgi:hypothetical protein
MIEKITKFPKSTWTRIKNRRGNSAVNCIVSGRYLKFGNVSDSLTEDGFVITVTVMTDTDNEKPDRKMCDLIVPVSELRKMIARSEDEIAILPSQD